MRRKRESGSSILAVMVISTLVTAVVMVVLMASSTLRQQSTASLERSAALNQARSGVSITAAFLNQKLSTGVPLKPGTSEWVAYTDPTGVVVANYFVVFGCGGNGTPTCTIDGANNATKLLTTGSAAAVAGNSRSAWIAEARAYVGGPNCPADRTYVARVEMVGDWNTVSYYYHVVSVARTNDLAARSGQKPVVLMNQAALVPFTRLPFQVAGMTGLQGVIINGVGTFDTTAAAPASTPMLASNGDITLR